MSRYLGDFLAGKVVWAEFNTANGSPMVPTSLVSGTIQIVKDRTPVSPSGGFTLTADADSVTGRNKLVVDMSVDATTFAAGHDYKAYLLTGTVGGNSVVGDVIAEWSVQNRSVAVDSAGGVNTTLMLGQVPTVGPVLPADAGVVSGVVSGTQVQSTSITLNTHPGAYSASGQNFLKWITGANSGAKYLITNYTYTGGTATITCSVTFNVLPSVNDQFAIV